MCQGRVGAVFALEASRLARHSRDWHHVIDLCAFTETLLLDDDGVYDPRQLNDRLLLGMKGSMAEYELGLLRQRAREAFAQKTRRGQAMWDVPVGCVQTEDDRIDKRAESQVQHAIAGVFTPCRVLGSARQTTLWYRDAQLPLPEVSPGTAGYEIIWRLPSGQRMNQIWTNPWYAGALVSGRTAAKIVIEDGRARQHARWKQPREQWRIVLVGHHPGSLSWEEFLQNHHVLEANRAMPEDAPGGAVKRGAAWRSGVRRCGRGGRKLNVVYSGTNGRVPRDVCRGGRVDRGASSCLTLGALRVDQAVATAVRDVVQPAGIHAAFEALEQVMATHETQHQAVERALEKARYEAQRARRHSDRVDPDNRLVAGELERRWNEAFVRVAEVEAHLATLASHRVAIDDEQRQRFQHLGDDLAVVWQHPTAPVELTKRMVRTVLHAIIIDTTQEPPAHRLTLHWQGGVHTELRVPRHRVGPHRSVTAPEVLELIRALSKVCQDQTIAATRHRVGSRTATGKTWRAHSVASMRSTPRLPHVAKGQEWLTLAHAAQQLGVSATVIRRLIRHGTLPARQVVPLAPWIIHASDLALLAVQTEVQVMPVGRRHPGRGPGQPALPGQASSPAGDAHAVASSAETCSLNLMSGEP